MRDYFDAEMRLLHETAQEFARAYPEQAGMLSLGALKDRDPYVERLLEGVAYLTAHIRQRIDDELPEMSEGLLGLLWPHFLRPMPSLTIMEFVPRTGQLQETKMLPRHSEIVAAPLTVDTPVGKESVSCRFRTVYPLDVHPIRISAASTTERSSGGTVLRLAFEVEPGIKIENLELSRVPLYLHADPAVVMALYKALAGSVESVQIRFPAQPLVGGRRLGGQECVEPCHLTPDDSLIPLNGRSFAGFHLLHDYFSFREKYFFIALKNLDHASFPPQTREFEVEIRVRDLLPAEVHVSAEMFRLHCVPAINLFPLQAEPVRLTQRRHEYPVIADAVNRYSTEVYSVEQVTSMDAKSSVRHVYNPLYSFKHYKGGRYFQAVRRVLGSGRREMYITVSDGGDFREQTLSCDVMATNGSVPREHLQIGAINMPGSVFPSYLSFRNITRPTRMLLPPDRESFQWTLISHLSMNYASIADTDVLRRLLHLYDWTGEEANERRIEGLEVISAHAADMMHKGVFMSGMEMRLRARDDAYGSVADCYCFIHVLHRFFSSYANINSFVRTRASTQPSNEEFVWQPTLAVTTN